MSSKEVLNSTIAEDQEHGYENENLEYENGPPQACLFVASLSTETKEDTLAENFGRYGTVLKVTILKDRASRPYAFVQYRTVEEAENALEQTNGTILDNRRLRVEKAKVNRTLFLAKLPKELSNNQLREIVQEYGQVESVTIIKNHQTNKSKGCGFVKFVYREDAIEAFTGLKNNYRKWVIEWATSTNDPDLLGVDKYNIFVGGLNPHKIEKELLEQRFGYYGEIESITLINRAADKAESTDSDGTQRSAFAFVRYKNFAHSASAIENENGTEWLDRRIRVQYCESQEMKNKRRANKYFLGYGNGQGYYSQGMQLPMMMVGGMPVYSHTNNYPYIDGVDMQNNLYNSPSFPPFPIFPYNNAPWLYGPPMAHVPENLETIESDLVVDGLPPLDESGQPVESIPHMSPGGVSLAPWS